MKWIAKKSTVVLSKPLRKG